jgi:hypothetical protein
MSRVGRAGLLEVALCLGVYPALGAQELGSMAGTVVDNVSGEPVGSALVSIASLGLLARTDEGGQFVFAQLPMGSREVKFEAQGYVSVVERLEVASGGYLQIRLDPVAAVLNEILAIVGRSTGAGGDDVRRVSGDNGARQSALDLLEDQVPGVTVRRGGGFGNGAGILIRGVSTFSTSMAPAIFVDGVRIDNGQAGANSLHELDMLPAEMVARIRVLKGASATSAFASGANGVILIETILGSGPGG